MGWRGFTRTERKTGRGDPDVKLSIAHEEKDLEEGSWETSKIKLGGVLVNLCWFLCSEEGSKKLQLYHCNFD